MRRLDQATIARARRWPLPNFDADLARGCALMCGRLDDALGGALLRVA